MQVSVGPDTDLAYLAESHPDLAFEEFNRRQGSATENPHTPLRTTQHAKPAGTQSRQEALNSNGQVLSQNKLHSALCFLTAG